MKKKVIDKAAIGVAIGFIGMALCVVLAVLNANGREIRDFLLWLFADARGLIGMSIGMVIAFGVALCAWKDINNTIAGE